MSAPAGIRINLLPHRTRMRQRRERLLLLWLAGGALSGLLLVLVAGAAIHISTAGYLQRAQDLRRASSTLVEAARAVRQAQQEIAQLTARQQAVSQLQAQRNDPVQLLITLAQAVPAGVTLHGLRQEGAQVRLEGRAPAQQQVTQLMAALAQALPQAHPQLLEVRAAQAGGVELVLQLHWPARACTAPGGASC